MFHYISAYTIEELITDYAIHHLGLNRPVVEYIPEHGGGFSVRISEDVPNDAEEGPDDDDDSPSPKRKAEPSPELMKALNFLLKKDGTDKQ